MCEFVLLFGRRAAPSESSQVHDRRSWAISCGGRLYDERTLPRGAGYAATIKPPRKEAANNRWVGPGEKALLA